MLIDERAGQRPLALTAGVLKVLACGVIVGVGSGPIWGSDGTAWRIELDARGVGSSTRGITLGFVGVWSFDPEERGDEISANPQGLVVPSWRGGDMVPDTADDPNSGLSRSGVSASITAFHSLEAIMDEIEDPGECAEGVYRKTISLQRWNTNSEIWSFQLTASKKAISFVLISCVLRPDILLHARAEKFRSWRYFDAKISAARNIRRPHCMAREDCVSSDCSMVKSCFGIQGLMRIR